uniref:Uncharacterized protein LOC116947755 n=1 Tax=Petromyzon marinus TaxID=7757 RepID=A0AAJ7TND8_PETMA|nr:uncharacterized protein LOC116947755 [Petromyzon marinus]XP_032819753.1 uncharacterized protein LOC116947755 [Petromyzon marinus]
MVLLAGRRCHACVALCMVLASLLLTDSYLVSQQQGGRRMAVSILNLVGDVCFLLILRYVAVWVGAEARTPRRAYASILWFLYVFVLEIKLYFVCQNYRGEASTLSPSSPSSSSSSSSSAATSSAVADDTGLGRKLLTLFLSVCVPGLYVILVAVDRLDCLDTDGSSSLDDDDDDEDDRDDSNVDGNGCSTVDRDRADEDDEASGAGRCTRSQDAALSGDPQPPPASPEEEEEAAAAERRRERRNRQRRRAAAAPPRGPPPRAAHERALAEALSCLLLQRKEEVRSHVFVVALDLLDVLDVQAGLWESRAAAPGRSSAVPAFGSSSSSSFSSSSSSSLPPLWAENLTFFYCYILLLVLPCVSLSELGSLLDRGTTLYPALSLITINVVAVFVRAVTLVLYAGASVSTIFIGKNILALMLKTCSLLEFVRQVPDGAQQQQQLPPALVMGGGGGCGGGGNMATGAAIAELQLVTTHRQLSHEPLVAHIHQQVPNSCLGDDAALTAAGAAAAFSFNSLHRGDGVAEASGQRTLPLNLPTQNRSLMPADVS